MQTAAKMWAGGLRCDMVKSLNTPIADQIAKARRRGAHFAVVLEDHVFNMSNSVSVFDLETNGAPDIVHLVQLVPFLQRKLEKVSNRERRQSTSPPSPPIPLAGHETHTRSKFLTRVGIKRSLPGKDGTNMRGDYS